MKVGAGGGSFHFGACSSRLNPVALGAPGAGGGGPVVAGAEAACGGST